MILAYHFRKRYLMTLDIIIIVFGIALTTGGLCVSGEGTHSGDRIAYKEILNDDDGNQEDGLHNILFRSILDTIASPLIKKPHQNCNRGADG